MDSYIKVTLSNLIEVPVYTECHIRYEEVSGPSKRRLWEGLKNRDIPKTHPVVTRDTQGRLLKYCIR